MFHIIKGLILYTAVSATVDTGQKTGRDIRIWYRVKDVHSRDHHAQTMLVRRVQRYRMISRLKWETWEWWEWWARIECLFTELTPPYYYLLHLEGDMFAWRSLCV